jgi:hypothetical protein
MFFQTHHLDIIACDASSFVVGGQEIQNACPSSVMWE